MALKELDYTDVSTILTANSGNANQNPAGSSMCAYTGMGIIRPLLSFTLGGQTQKSYQQTRTCVTTNSATSTKTKS